MGIVYEEEKKDKNRREIRMAIWNKTSATIDVTLG